MRKDILSLNWRSINAESKIYTYKVCEDGKIIKASKKHCIESRVQPYNKRGKLAVKISGKEYLVKHLVAQSFIPGYKKGDNVCHKDGNYKNCRADNLFVISKHDLGKVTGGDSKRKAVILNGEEYYSVRSCAKALNCSYQTLLDYLNGKVRHSVLDGVCVQYAE